MLRDSHYTNNQRKKQNRAPNKKPYKEYPTYFYVHFINSQINFHISVFYSRILLTIFQK